MSRCRAVLLLLAAVGVARAEAAPVDSMGTGFEAAPADSEAAGLLHGGGDGWSWSAGFEAALAGFVYDRPLFTNEHPDPSGELGGDWFEGYVEPWLRGEIGVGRSRFTGELSLLATWTGGASDELVGGSAAALRVEQAQVAWASGDLWPGLGRDALEVRAGRFDFGLGTGMVLQIGSSNGGERGAYYLAPRQAWALGAVTRFATGPHALRAFYLDPDAAVPEEEARIAGLDYEVGLAADRLDVGASWFRVVDAADSTRDGMSVLSLRTGTSPVPPLPDLRLDGEVVNERHGDRLQAWGWYAQAGYSFPAAGWAPSLRYRYAEFGGDDPATTRSESFDPLRYAFTDYGTWYQGEIYGVYLLSNSDLRSQQLALECAPSEAVSLRLLFYDFSLDRLAMLESGAEVRHLGGEVDLIVEWELTSAVSLTIVGARAWLDDVLQEEFDHPGDLSYVMPLVTVSF